MTAKLNLYREVPMRSLSNKHPNALTYVAVENVPHMAMIKAQILDKIRNFFLYLDQAIQVREILDEVGDMDVRWSCKYKRGKERLFLHGD